MADIFRFRKFPVYNDARKFRSELKNFLKNKIPKSEEYIIKPQIWRALDSVILNIAEGSERYSDADFSRFLNTSLASTYEVVASLDLLEDDGIISHEDNILFSKKAENIFRQLRAFCSKVKKDSK